MQIQPFGIENYQMNQNCSQHSSHHGVDIALRELPYGIPTGSEQFQKVMEGKVGRLRTR